MKERIIVFVGLTFILFSCNSTKKSSDNKENDVVIKKENDMTSKISDTYIVKELNGKKELVVNPTIVFADNAVSGNSGCNRYGGKFTITGNKIKFGALMGTKMYCEDFMHIEKDFLDAMSKADYFKIDGNRLLLFDEANKLLLIGYKS